MTHLTDYLDYYQTLEAPGYAVLVTGKWGVGKTHQVRQCFPEDGCYYVSLFGLRTPEEAHAAVYAAYAPNLNKFEEGIGKLGAAAENAGGLISLAGSASGWLSAAFRQQVEPDRPLIFDDLERCGMKLEEMMGVFSTYSEHLGFLVVLIADEKKLAKKFKGYPKAKEKVVGHTAKVVPMTSGAFDFFVTEVDEVPGAYIQGQKTLILEVFESSKCESLRVLRHVVLDLARLHGQLLPKHLDHEAAMSEIIRLFVSLEIEVRLGRLEPRDLKNRAGQRRSFELRRHVDKDVDVKTPPLITADTRYPTIDLESQILDDQVLEAIFDHGVFCGEMIREAIERSQRNCQRKLG